MYYIFIFLCSLFMGTTIQSQEQKPKSFEEIRGILKKQLEDSYQKKADWRNYTIPKLYAPYIYKIEDSNDESITPQIKSEVEKFLTDCNINPMRITLKKSSNNKTYIDFSKNDEGTDFKGCILFVGSTEKKDLEKAIIPLLNTTPYDSLVSKATVLFRTGEIATNDPSFTFKELEKCKTVPGRLPYNLSNLTFTEKHNSNKTPHPASYCSLIEDIARIHQEKNTQTPKKSHRKHTCYALANWYYNKRKNTISI